ncbi:YceI family protein [Chitinophaga cymbidii]|uniref:Polyisoprenoid-binding protein n=1 Tax=Chitinophaga cymbidii TaxID=1096750 RepID=A0A512RG31_9BACT|nr:YceI family protein [Chitinophaga cymbidii]GEP94677.1 polyisoprenoid-binding protein [Chitinophaga cymbidii]
MQYKVLVLFSFLLAVACQQVPKADKAAITDPQAVKQPEEGHAHQLDTSASTLYWIGTKPTGEHKGSFRFLEGQLYEKDSTLTGGQFVININSLRNIDLQPQPDMKSKLEEELRGENFFDAARFPTARFEITEVSSYQPSEKDKGVLLKDATHMIKGNLTMKSVTKNITFPAKIVLQDGKVKAEANFNIDRTQWGMTYRADKSVQDKLINSIVNIHFEIITR